MTTTLVEQDDADDALADTNATDSLTECEDQIEQAKRDILVSWSEIGTALERVRAGRLYKAGGYERFEDWSKERFGLSKSHAYRLIEAAAALADIAARIGGGDSAELEEGSSPASVVIPEAVLRTEHHARALLPLWKSDPNAAAEVVQDLAATGSTHTAKDIVNAVAAKSERPLSGSIGERTRSIEADDELLAPFPGSGGLPAPPREPGPGEFADGRGSSEPLTSFGEDEPTVDAEMFAQTLVEAGYALIGKASGIGTSGPPVLPLHLSLPIEGGEIDIEVRFRPTSVTTPSADALPVDAPADTPMFRCPRCGAESDTRLYGVCPTCVESLRVAGADKDDVDDEDEDMSF